MKPCYVFGPWTIRPSSDPIAAVREAPNPSERAEVWLYTQEDDGTPVSDDVAGWYGCFGAMTDSVRLGPAAPAMSINGAMASLDQMIREAGHLFAEDVERMRELRDGLLSLVSRANTAERLVCVFANAADLVHERLNLIQPYFAIWKDEGEAIEEIRRRLDESGTCKRATDLSGWAVYAEKEMWERLERAEKRVAELEAAEGQTVAQRDRAEAMADRLAARLAAGRDIGEHSSGNDPWQNALDLHEFAPARASVQSVLGLAQELYEASKDGPTQNWSWNIAPPVVRQVWVEVAELVLRKYGQPPATSPQEQGQWRDVVVYNPPTPTRRATDADSPIGDDRAPDRYMASGRETIDEVRDVCHALAGNDEKAANALFAAHCLLDAYVYLARAGRKGDAASDHAKSNWYLRMAAYVAGIKTPDGAPYTDPRAHRPTYTPYQRHPHALKRIDWGDFPIRDLLGAIAFGI